MKNTTIDINVDLGEGVGNEALLMPFISSCNIACGGHAGDLQTMREVVNLAKRRDVKVGAHPSFPDKEHFGRHIIEMPNSDLFVSIKQQIEALLGILDNEQVPLNHIKLHGALYNLAAVNKNTAQVVVDVVKSFDFPVRLYVPFKSVIADFAITNNIKIIYEAFADRNYNDDLTLVSRTQKDAVIHDSNRMFNHVLSIVNDKAVKTISGTYKHIEAETFCIHGDNPNAVELIKYLRMHLETKHIFVS